MINADNLVKTYETLNKKFKLTAEEQNGGKYEYRWIVYGYK